MPDREQAHRRIYDQHASLLAAALLVILKRLNLDDLSAHLVQQAAIQTDAGSDPVMRRRVVSGLAYAAIAQQIHAADRQILDGRNADAWMHATAYGAGEAKASPPTGGPLKKAEVIAGAALALKLISKSEAQSATTLWTDDELRSVAMAAALAAGDGKAFDVAVRAVKAAITSDTEGSGLLRAKKVYADKLHNALSQSFVQTVQAANPRAWFDWVAMADACPVCEDLAVEGPYPGDAMPEYPPDHPNCRCSIAVAAPIGASSAP